MTLNMRTNNKIVVFDFDGVVCDSTNECMVTSWNAWQRMNGSAKFRQYVDQFSDLEKEEFRAVRPLVRGAGEYYILRRAFVEGIVISGQEIFDQLGEQWSTFLEPFKNIFFEVRNELRSRNIDEWINLHPVYGEVIEVMKMLCDHRQLYIATLKDKESVQLILQKNGVNIAADLIFDQSIIETKLQGLEEIMLSAGCSKADMIFIDDNATHLIKPNAAEYSVFLSAWGNVVEEYLDIANQHNIPVLMDFDELFCLLRRD